MAGYTKNYITPEYYIALQQMGLSYEGFVTGMGYAYTVNLAIAPPHMDIFNPPRFVPPGMDKFIYGRMQCLDSSMDALARSYNMQSSDIAEKVIRYNYNDNTIVVNMGNNQYMTLPQGKSAVNISVNENFEDVHIVISAQNSETGEFRETKTKLVDMPMVFGNFGGDNIEFSGNQNSAQNNSNDTLKKISFITGCMSMGYSAWAENGFDGKTYLPKKGPNIGQPTSVYKTTKKGNIANKFGKPQPRSGNALSKIKLARWVKIGGVFLNTAGIGFTFYDIWETKEFTAEHGFDLAFGVVAFFPGGWLLSGIYFIGKEAFNDMPQMSVPVRDFREPYYAPMDNTRVVMPNYELYKPALHY